MGPKGVTRNYIRVFRRQLIPDVASDGPWCDHLGAAPELPEPATDTCAACVASGDTWLHLRMCLECGNVACCDSSLNRHATGHFEASGHPTMRGIGPGEHWAFCYVDKVTSRPR